MGVEFVIGCRKHIMQQKNKRKKNKEIELKNSSLNSFFRFFLFFFKNVEKEPKIFPKTWKKNKKKSSRTIKFCVLFPQKKKKREQEQHVLQSLLVS